MKLSHRLDRLSPYLFVEINRKIAEKQVKGEDIISFARLSPGGIRNTLEWHLTRIKRCCR